MLKSIKIRLYPNKIQQNYINNLVGCLFLYQAPKCPRHWVTLLPHGNNNFLVVDSEHLDLKIHDIKERKKVYFHKGNAEVLESIDDVLKYFKECVGVLSIYK